LTFYLQAVLYVGSLISVITCKSIIQQSAERTELAAKFWRHGDARTAKKTEF
jgi:hypothetical protein